ncbi:hypothetical protein CPB83DRAFT_849810 [Crepidotus variabilis]|uniref:Uncharacterized protein n=1 Tax=Crepidotus variabilis TaxID=179855 RepID=A0A9P6EKN3_9AGAR|nr:hypothetical protein CPB83DRAFT_849810 [Crepidotus variabilis]
MIDILNVLITSFSDISSATIAAWARNSIAFNTQTVGLNTFDSIMEHWASIGSEAKGPNDVEKVTAAPPMAMLKGLPKQTHDATGQRLYYLTTLKVPPNTPVVPASTSCQPLLSNEQLVVLEADSCISTEPPSSTASSFDLSSSSVTSDNDDLFISDSSFSATSSVGKDFGIPKGVGLGLSGFTTKGADKPFDGLGLVDIHGWVRQADLEELHQSGCDHDSCYGSTRPPTPSNSSNGVSSTFLRETLHTFMEDPFHEQSLDTIPECQSWCEVDCVTNTLEDELLTQSHQRHETNVYPIGRGHGAGVLPRPRKHFSSATISSQLKSVTHPIERQRLTSLRARASTWPTHRFSGGTTESRSLGWRV